MPVESRAVIFKRDVRLSCADVAETLARIESGPAATAAGSSARSSTNVFHLPQ